MDEQPLVEGPKRVPAQHQARPQEANKPVRVVFSGARGPLTKLAIKNTILTLLTIGFYRFWAKTHLRRYFWQNVRLGNDPFEYTGTGKELFLGFLIAVACLLPLGIVYNVAATMAVASGFGAQIAVDLVYYVLIIALINVAVFRMWRYRLSRTSWRGLSFSLEGSTWGYLGRSMGWTFLTMITGGLAYPWMRVALWRYRTNHSSFGDGRFKFKGKAGSLLLPYLVATFFPMLAFGAYFYFADLMSVFEAMAAQQPDAEFPDSFPFFLGAFVIVFGLLSAWYGVREFRLFAKGTSLERMRIHSDLTFGQVIKPVLIFLAIFAATVGLSVFIMTHSVITGSVLLVLAFIFVLPVAAIVIRDYGVLKATFQSLRVSDLSHLDQITRNANARSKTGEGLADAFDVGAF